MPKTHKDTLEKLATAVIKERPGLKSILAKHGDLKISKYAEKFKHRHKSVETTLHNNFVDSVIRSTQNLFGKKIAKKIGKDIRENYYALTGDHHGPLTHPFFLNSALLAGSQTPHTSSLLVLASSNVSLNNSSHPRGFLYTANRKLNKLNLLPSKHSMTPVYSAKGFTTADLDRLTKEINNLSEGKKLQRLLTILNQDKIRKQKRFSDQVSLINHDLWEEFFPGQAKTKLVYLELEKIVVDLLLTHHIKHPTIIHKIIFSPEHRQVFIDNFKNIPGSFGDNHGTVLFWYLPKNSGKRIGLRVKDGYFVSTDLSHKIKITPANIKKLLANNELIPGTVFALLIVSAYYGVKCLGGFSQTTYLTQAQNLYNQLFQSKEPDHEEHTQTMGADMVIAYVKFQGHLVPATGLDLILYGHDKSWHNFMDTARSISLREAFYPLLPELFQELYGKDGNLKLTKIDTKKILTTLRLNRRICPVGSHDS